MNPVCNPVRLIGKRYKAFHYLNWNKKTLVFSLLSLSNYQNRLTTVSWKIRKYKKYIQILKLIANKKEPILFYFLILPILFYFLIYNLYKKDNAFNFPKKNSKTVVMIFLLCSRVEKMMQKWRRKNFSLKKLNWKTKIVV